MKTLLVLYQAAEERFADLFEAQGRSKNGLFHAERCAIHSGTLINLRNGDRVARCDFAVLLVTSERASELTVSVVGQLRSMGLRVIALRSNRISRHLRSEEFPVLEWTWGNVQRIAAAKYVPE